MLGVYKVMNFSTALVLLYIFGLFFCQKFCLVGRVMAAVKRQEVLKELMLGRLLILFQNHLQKQQTKAKKGRKGKVIIHPKTMKI